MAGMSRRTPILANRPPLEIEARIVVPLARSGFPISCASGVYRFRQPALRANDDEINTCREFTLGGIGQTSSGYAPNQTQHDSCSSRR